MLAMSISKQIIWATILPEGPCDPRNPCNPGGPIYNNKIIMAWKLERNSFL